MSAQSVNPQTLLVIFSHSKANETVRRHWPYYLNSGCDILGVGRTDTHCQWPVPDGRFIGEINVGKESYANGDNHIVRFLDTLEHCMNAPELKKYKAWAFIEYDGVLFAPIPTPRIDTFYGKRAGYKDQGFLGQQYLHTPWIFDRIMAGRVLKAGRAMLQAGLIERGFLDRWFGLMIDLYDLDWKDTGAETYTQNSLDTTEKISDARRAIAAGCFYVHGIKTESQLKELTA